MAAFVGMMAGLMAGLMARRAASAATLAFGNRMRFLCQQAALEPDPLSHDAIHRQIATEVYAAFQNIPVIWREQAAGNMLSATAQYPISVGQLWLFGPHELARRWPLIAPVIYATADVLMPGWDQMSTATPGFPGYNWGQYSSPAQAIFSPLSSVQQTPLEVPSPQRLQPLGALGTPLQSPLLFGQQYPAAQQRQGRLHGSRKEASDSSPPAELRLGHQQVDVSRPRGTPARPSPSTGDRHEDHYAALFANKEKLHIAKTPEEKRAVRMETMELVDQRGRAIDNQMDKILEKHRAANQWQPKSPLQQRKDELIIEAMDMRDRSDAFRNAAVQIMGNPGMRVGDLRAIVDAFEPNMRDMAGHEVMDQLAAQLDQAALDEAQQPPTRKMAPFGKGREGDTGAGKAEELAVHQRPGDESIPTDISLHVHRLRQHRLFARWGEFQKYAALMPNNEKLHPEVGLELAWNYFLQGCVGTALDVADRSCGQGGSAWPNQTARNALLLARSFFGLLSRCEIQAALDVAMSIQNINEAPLAGVRLSDTEIAMNYFYYKILTIAIYEGLLDTEVFKPLVQTRLQAILQILQETGQSHDIVLFSLFLADQSTSEHDKENILRPLLENPTLLPVDRAHVALELGVAAATSGDASKAAPLFQSAEELFEQSSCRDGILKSRLQRLDMTSPMTASTFEEMLQLANAFEKLNSVASEFSTLFHAMTAAAELASWNNFTSAFDRARIVSSRTKNGYFLLKIHLTFAANMVTWPQHLGKSVATLREFLDPASTQTPRTSGQASLLLGQVCTLLGDKENGLKYAKRAVKEFEKGCDYELISDAKLALALAMDSGETGGQLAVKLLTDSLTLDKQHNYLKGQIAKYDALVWLESRLAQHGGSSEGFHNARQMLWMVKREALKSRETPNALLRRAKICVATKEFNDAEKLAKEALAELSSRDNVREVAQCQNIIFQSYFRNPTPAAGDSAILDQARLTFEAYRNLGLENIPVEFIMEISMAFEEIGQRHPEDKIHLHSEALGYLKVGQSVCERNRADLSDSSGLASLRQKQLLVASVFQSDIRTRALRLSLGLGDGEKLWEWTQTAKARALADTVAPRLISAAALSPELIGDTEAVEILEEEERLLEELQGAHAGESIELRIKLDRLHARMDGHSSLSHLLASRDGVRGLEDLDWIFKGDAARRLPENKKIVLVDWVFVGEAIVMITLDSSLKPQLSSLDITVSQIRQWKRKHLSIVETTQSRDQLLLLDRARLDEISGLVSELGRLSSEGDLLVLCPTLVLHAIPLHALTYDGSHILIARNPVVYSTSLSLLRQCCRRADARKRGNSLRAAVFAVYEDKASERENKASERENKASEREKIYSCMRKLACDFKTEPLLGPYATRHNLESLVRGVDILHYHGHMDEHVNVLHQSLRLSRGHKEPAGSGADDGGGDDDAFTVRDAFALRIDAALACMVACSSGVQAFTPGDEPQGMLAALQVAGCASAVGTLWPVDSRDGRDFAGYFYRALHKQHGAGGPVNVAICFQKAVLRLLNRREAGYKGEEIRVPYHWAAFVLHGAWYL